MWDVHIMRSCYVEALWEFLPRTTVEKICSYRDRSIEIIIMVYEVLAHRNNTWNGYFLHICEYSPVPLIRPSTLLWFSDKPPLSTCSEAQQNPYSISSPVLSCRKYNNFPSASALMSNIVSTGVTGDALATQGVLHQSLHSACVL